MNNAFRQLLRQAPFCLVLLTVLFSAGCARPPAAPTAWRVRVAGARDMQAVVDAVSGGFATADRKFIEFIPSTDPLADLKAGRADAVLLGREPTTIELMQMEDHVVAYDAVCIVINERTYLGGIQDKYLSGAANMHGQPVAKYSGLSNLSLQDLRGLVGKTYRFPNLIWGLSGPDAGFFTFEPYLDDLGNQTPDPDNPGWVLGNWVWNGISVSMMALPPGMFDTQSALLQTLMIPESVLSNPAIVFLPATYNSEELMISQQFDIDPYEAQSESFQPFDYTMEIASRRVTLAAIRHGFAIRALSIEGVDPLGDPSLIYTGNYPLSRRIHLIIPDPYALPAKLLANFLESAQGQTLLARSDFLPLPPP
jgi:hypothetical protein